MKLHTYVKSALKYGALHIEDLAVFKSKEEMMQQIEEDIKIERINCGLEECDMNEYAQLVRDGNEIRIEDIETGEIHVMWTILEKEVA